MTGAEGAAVRAQAGMPSRNPESISHPSNMRIEEMHTTTALLACAAAVVIGGGWFAPMISAGHATPAGRVGVELDGLGDGARERPFVDVAKTLRPWTALDGKPVQVDEHGWPMGDAQVVLFDIRPFAAWEGPDHIDDPLKFMPDWSGVYKLSFHGSAKLRVTEDSRCTVTNQRYSPASNLTTADVTAPKGAGLLVLQFSDSLRSQAAPPHSGITGLRVLRPGYAADTKEIFTREFLRSLRPFAVLRYMDWLDTNHNPGYYGD